MRDIETICREIADCEDEIVTAKTADAPDRGARITKEVTVARLERRRVGLIAERDGWIEEGGEARLKALKAAEARASIGPNGSATKTD